MTTADPPDSPQLGCSKLGRELYRDRISYSLGEHPNAVVCLIGIILIIAALFSDIVNNSHSRASKYRVAGRSLLIFLCIVVVYYIVGFVICPNTYGLLSNPDDALFFLKLVTTSYSWDEKGRIMNSYLFQREICSTSSYFYNGQQFYDFFVSYSKSCTDPVIQVFIKHAKSNLGKIMGRQWDRIELPGE